MPHIAMHRYSSQGCTRAALGICGCVVRGPLWPGGHPQAGQAWGDKSSHAPCCKRTDSTRCTCTLSSLPVCLQAIYGAGTALRSAQAAMRSKCVIMRAVRHAIMTAAGHKGTGILATAANTSASRVGHELPGSTK